MAERVYVHIGAPKSGTTYLQSVLFANQERLRGMGVLVPGSQPFDHTRAANAVSSRRPAVVAEGSRYATWATLLAEIAEWPGTAILSNEWFVKATQKQVGVALDELAPARVDVIFTARDFARQAPAAWQEELKLGRSSRLDDFIEALDEPGTKWSWSTLDPAVVLPRWAAHVPADQVHVVTVPPPGTEPGLLWRRFATLCGIDPDRCDLRPTQANESLSAEAARLLQELGPMLRTAIDADNQPWHEKYRWIRRFVSHHLLVPMRGSVIGVGERSLSRLRQRGLRTASALEASGWDLVGDLRELNPEKQPVGRHPDDVTEGELLTLSMRLNAAMLAHIRHQAGLDTHDTS